MEQKNHEPSFTDVLDLIYQLRSSPKDYELFLKDYKKVMTDLKVAEREVASDVIKKIEEKEEEIQ